MRLALRLLALVTTVVVLGGCGDDDEPVASGDATTVPGGAALAEEYLSVEVTEAGEPRALVAGTVISLRFDGDRIGASLGCNSLGGVYRLDGDVLVVEDGLSMTEMGCDRERHAQDEWFAELLTSRPTLAISDDVLTLTAGDTGVRFQDREVADPDQELVGTTWELDGFLEGIGPDGVAMSIGVEEPATLMLREDGLVVGSDGCNSFGFGTDQDQVVEGVRYEVDGDRITFSGAPVSTLVGCPDLEDHVARVRAVLSGTVTWEIDAERLTLVAADGRGVTYRAAR